MTRPGLCRLYRRRRAVRCSVLALAGAGLGLIAWAAVSSPTPRIVYNASASAPLGFYRVLPVQPLRRGDLVLAHTPDSMRQLAARRGYLPATVPLVKRIAALSGDRVCATGKVIRINGVAFATRRAADGAGRPMPRWTGCRTLQSSEVFLLMAGVPNAFDGRYFGPSALRDVVGRLVRP